VRRAQEEEDEGVVAELLGALGRLGGTEALETLAAFAEAGGLLRRRTPFVRAAAMAALGTLRVPEARALLTLYSQDREPTVRRAAEAAMR
jgi:HEAT repeat protein